MASSPYFFRIVLQSSLRERKLMIPTKFVRKYGDFLPSPVRIKLPDGEEWKVELTTVDGMVWLHNGWHEFAEHYCLEFGSLLVFRYDGNSIFHTIIFNPTGLEIEYSCNEADGYEAGDDEDSDEIVANFPQHPKKREKASLLFHQPRKKMRSECSFRPKMEPQEYNFVRERRPRDGVIARRRQRPLSAVKKAEAVQSSSFLKSENPGFRILMRQSNVKGRFNMMIPKRFAQEYLNKGGGTITIQISNGRTWSLKYKWAQRQIRTSFAYISSGWKPFAKANCLKEGDIGVFKLIRKDKFLFTKEENSSNIAQARMNQSSVARTKTRTTHVRIKPEVEDNADLRHGSPRASSGGVEDAIKFIPRHPFFEVDLGTKSYKHSHRILTIPASFAREHFAPNMCTAKLGVRNKEWRVKLLQYHKYARFSTGWSAFYWENCLEMGKKCVFELVSKKDCAFKVTIF